MAVKSPFYSWLIVRCSIDMGKRVIIIGVGGASCSGKTVLAKHLQSVLPGSVLIHQDDFAPPPPQIPLVGDPPVQDWDDPSTAIKWDEFKDALSKIRNDGELSHITHDHLNELPSVRVDNNAKARWASEFTDDVKWVLVDGFVLYWDQAVTDDLDVRLFLRAPRDVLKARREARKTYVIEDGSVWEDPPNYFDEVVYPAYVKAHEGVFEGGVEHGHSRQLDVLTPSEGDMTEVFEEACRIIQMHSR